MSIKILGYGEIGKSIFLLFNEQKGFDIFVEDPKYNLYPPIKKEFDFVLVCIPYSDNFVQIVLDQQNISSKIVIFSTVPIGTTEQIPNAIHIPIEGKHPNLLDSLKIWQFYAGYNDVKYLPDYINLFSCINKSIIPIPKTRNTELCKLLSTLLYGVNIEFYRFAKDSFNKYACDSPDIFIDYNQDYNFLYEALGFPGIKRYILDYPKGDIGGHCVVPNAKFIEGVFPDIVRNQYSGVDNDY